MNNNCVKNKSNRSQSILAEWFPEVRVGGFTSLDGTVEFYGRVQAIVQPNMRVLDFGAGRGAGLQEDTCDFRRNLRVLRGKVERVIACDVDEAVLDNPGADEAVVIKLNESLPFESASFDLIIADFVFEHINNPALIAAEFRRVLKRGGWICARTPNKYCMISLVTHMIHNSRHSHVLRWVQPERQAMDIFPTVFKLNTKRAIAAFFPHTDFENFTYRYEAEPSYFFNSSAMFALMLLINWLTPMPMKSGFFIFLRKK